MVEGKVPPVWRTAIKVPWLEQDSECRNVGTKWSLAQLLREKTMRRSNAFAKTTATCICIGCRQSTQLPGEFPTEATFFMFYSIKENDLGTYCLQGIVYIRKIQKMWYQYPCLLSWQEPEIYPTPPPIYLLALSRCFGTQLLSTHPQPWLIKMLEMAPYHSIDLW